MKGKDHIFHFPKVFYLEVLIDYWLSIFLAATISKAAEPKDNSRIHFQKQKMNSKNYGSSLVLLLYVQKLILQEPQLLYQKMLKSKGKEGVTVNQ